MGFNANLQSQITNLLKQNHLYLATAESCTGGLLGHLITNTPGASAYYLGGQIAYTNQAKMRWLGVRTETLARCGAVSRETVLEMAQGIRCAFGGEMGEEKIISLSISGIAGPDGGTDAKPVGTVWIGLASPWGDEASEFHFNGDRLAIKMQSAEQTLKMLLDWLKHHI